MRRIIVICMLAVLALVVGCAGSTAKGADAKMETTKQTAQTAEKSSNKILIAYYSQKGTTQYAAQQIQGKIGGDLFEIKPTNPYPEPHDPCLVRQMQEIEQKARPTVAGKVENMTQYDVIFVGYPIWYYQAPMVVDTFMESYDFSGKVVIPFCTSGGYPIDDSEKVLQKCAPNATWKKGLRVERNGINLDSWLNNLKL